MRKIFFVFIFFSGPLFGQTDTTTSTLIEKDYRIQYPANWELNQASASGMTFLISSPAESEEDVFRENINLVIQDLSASRMDLTGFVLLSEDQMKQAITNLEILESVRVNNASGEFHRIVFKGGMGVYHFRFDQYYFVRNDRAFVLTFICQLEKIGKYEVMAKAMMDSFSVL